MKTVFVTGARGLIGKEALPPLLDQGFVVHALSSKEPPSRTDGVQWLKGDLFDASFLDAAFARLRPRYLLHFAWTTAREYLSSEINRRHQQAGLEMLRLFARHGGTNAMYAGTAFEYQFKNEPLRETDPLAPATLYARCKDGLRRQAEEYANGRGLTFGWGRIFYIYGRNEHPWRFTGDIVGSLAAGRKTVIRNGSLVRDYLYAKDAAAAMVKCLASGVGGVTNICSGAGVTLRDLAGIFARAMGREDLLVVNDEPTEQPRIIVGNGDRLMDLVGYRLRYSPESAALEIAADIA